jgi:hypothetical protein
MPVPWRSPALLGSDIYLSTISATCKVLTVSLRIQLYFACFERIELNLKEIEND